MLLSCRVALPVERVNLFNQVTRPLFLCGCDKGGCPVGAAGGQLGWREIGAITSGRLHASALPFRDFFRRKIRSILRSVDLSHRERRMNLFLLTTPPRLSGCEARHR